MHFHLPKPLHGWREFVGEVGIIVIGILIALGAEQVVEAWHWRVETRDFQSALNKEIEFDLAAYQFRVAQSPCVERRLSELERWSAEQRARKTVPLLHPIGDPRRVSPDTAIWNARSAELTAHIPVRARLTYSDLYETIEHDWTVLESEREAWLRLNGFNHATKLSPDELVELDELINRARSLNWIVLQEGPWYAPAKAEFGLRPSFGKMASGVTPPDPEFCKPLLPSRGG